MLMVSVHIDEEASEYSRIRKCADDLLYLQIVLCPLLSRRMQYRQTHLSKHKLHLGHAIQSRWTSK